MPPAACGSPPVIHSFILQGRAEWTRTTRPPLPGRSLSSELVVRVFSSAGRGRPLPSQLQLAGYAFQNHQHSARSASMPLTPRVSLITTTLAAVASGVPGEGRSHSAPAPRAGGRGRQSWGRGWIPVSPSCLWARELGERHGFRVLTAGGQPGTGESAGVGAPCEGGDAELPALAALQQAWAADKGLRRPRHASTHRAASRPLAGSGTLQSCGIAVALPLRGRARMGAGGGQGARGAGRPGESHGPGKAAGCAQKPDWPRRGGLGPRPEPARWAGHGAWTPPLTPVRPRGETWRFGKGELV